MIFEQINALTVTFMGQLVSEPRNKNSPRRKAPPLLPNMQNGLFSEEFL